MHQAVPIVETAHGFFPECHFLSGTHQYRTQNWHSLKVDRVLQGAYTADTDTYGNSNHPKLIASSVSVLLVNHQTLDLGLQPNQKT